MNETNTNKVGRPPTRIAWPNSRFTVETLRSATGLSKVSLYLKVKEALKAGVISVVDKEKSGGGRARVVYQVKTTAQEAPPTQETPAPQGLPLTEVLGATPAAAS